MSKEFEEVVLKKLDDLVTEVKETKQDLQQLAKDTNQRLDTLEIEMKETNQRISYLEVEMKDTKEIVTDLRQKFVVFDFEINKKIDTLFDANKVNLEKHAYFQEKIISLDDKNFNHDIRISALEDVTKSLTA